jgi:hypothetical protein
VNLTEEEKAEALATPLLAASEASEVDEFGAHLREYSRMTTTSSPQQGGSLSENTTTASSSSSGVGFSSMMMGTTSGGHGNGNPLVRGTIAQCLRIRTLADALPSMLQPVMANGKMSILFFVGGQIVLFGLWFPFWIFSLFLTEGGVYLAVAAKIALVGRAVLRMIAFPGSSHRVSNEIEKEFTKYSVRVITSSATSLIELAEAFRTASSSGGGNQHYNIRSLWKRAKSYNDRVLSVYAEVLHTTLEESGNGVAVSSPQQGVGATVGLDQYGNNRLVGDVGNLSGLTTEAISDGRVLLNHLQTVLRCVGTLEVQARTVLEYHPGGGGGPSDSARQAANSLMASATELRNFVESLKPPSVSVSGEGDENELLSANELQRRRLEEEQQQQQNSNSGSFTETIKMGIAAILPMLDPPLHSSIFGFDVLRGCVLSRYKGARQLWVNRPGGGRIDCLHVPAAKSTASSFPASSASAGGMDAFSSNSKAVLYCNPNAGLIEVATGMSLAGGNVSSDVDNGVNDNCWTDFYTNEGFDIYLYNYAGFGRSHGGAFCGMCSSGSGKATTYTPGAWGRIKRIVHGLLFSFRPTPDSLRADGLAVASHVVSNCGVESLVIHGESIGGLAASGTARSMTENIRLRNKVSLLLCDRTFCNLEATAQRLVGGWSGYAIRMLAPFWSTDVVGDFLAVSCPKVVATDSADAIIADSSSLKAGIAFWKEIQRSASSTKGIGWKIDAPLHYRMADWENVSVTGSRYVSQPRTTRMTPPVWPSDHHIAIDEAFHFAACAKRIGKLASIEKKRFALVTSSALRDTEADQVDSCSAPIYLVWKHLGCCEGLCGSALGVTVRGGFDITVSWLSSMCVFGGQTVVEGIEHRRRWSNEEASTKLQELGQAEGSDFDCRPPGYEHQESDAVVHPKPITEVLEALRQIVEENPNDNVLNSGEFFSLLILLLLVLKRFIPISCEINAHSFFLFGDFSTVSHEISFVMGTLEYVMFRLSAPATLEASFKSRHLNANGPMMEGSFMNLHCGHNNPYSAEERNRLKAILLQATRTPLPAVV